jgi:hypothetical protein
MVQKPPIHLWSFGDGLCLFYPHILRYEVRILKELQIEFPDPMKLTVSKFDSKKK